MSIEYTSVEQKLIVMSIMKRKEFVSNLFKAYQLMNERIYETSELIFGSTDKNCEKPVAVRRSTIRTRK